MLPQHQIEGDSITIPKLDIEEYEVEGFREELKGFHEEFKDCFQRIEGRRHFFQYMIGQISNLERKSVEPIVVKVEGGKV